MPIRRSLRRTASRSACSSARFAVQAEAGAVGARQRPASTSTTDAGTPTTSSAATRSCSIAALDRGAVQAGLGERAGGRVGVAGGEREQQVLGLDLLGAQAPRGVERAHDDAPAAVAQ